MGSVWPSVVVANAPGPTVVLASAMSRNQFSFRHSRKEIELKLSAKAFSVAFPGLGTDSESVPVLHVGIRAFSAWHLRRLKLQHVLVQTAQMFVRHIENRFVHE